MRFSGMILTAALFVAAPLAVADVAATARDSAIAADVTAVMAERDIPGAQVAIVTPDGACSALSR